MRRARIGRRLELGRILTPGARCGRWSPSAARHHGRLGARRPAPRRRDAGDHGARRRAAGHRVAPLQRLRGPDRDRAGHAAGPRGPGRDLARGGAAGPDDLPGPGTGSDDLASFERHVLAALRAKAVDGVIPATALTTGTEDASARWHRVLTRLVVADAQRRGRPSTVGLKRAVQLVGAGVVDRRVAPPRRSSAGRRGPPGCRSSHRAATISGARHGAQRRYRTDAALDRAAAHPRRARPPSPLAAGVRTSRRTSSCRLPAGAVKLYGRHLAYAAGFGLADHAVTALPFGEEDDHLAWSAKVASGDRSESVPAGAAAGLGAAPSCARNLLGARLRRDLGLPARRRRQLRTNAAGPGGDGLGVPAGLEPLGAQRGHPGPVHGTRRSPERCCAVTAAAHPRVERPHRYWYYVAVDDSTRGQIAAYRVSEGQYQSVRQGQTVTAEATPRLGYVRDLR